jgi:YHS domain-containing protein
LIKADCSINWRDQDGKLYCFASGTSLNYFQDFPKANIRKASEAFERLTHPKPGS